MAISKLVSNASKQAARAQRAFVAQSVVAARSAAGVGVDAAREAARITSYTVPTDVLTASDAGDGTATIHVLAHTRVYPVQGGLEVPPVAIPAFDITEQPLGTDLFPYYDDLTLSVTTPAGLVETVGENAAAGAAPGRHSLGAVTTPAAGGADTDGTGGTPPSWPYQKTFDI